MKLKLILLTALTVLGIFLPKLSLAASYSIRLGQPKSSTGLNNFRLTFVALDPQGRQITVKCFKKGPSDGGFTQFDVNKVLIPGGNTDYCEVNSSIVNTNGTYSFYTTAEIVGDVTLTSNTVNVDFNNSGPETPNSYSKERLNSCDYKIKFRTANDGKTVKVQLFRSDTYNISVGASSVLTQQNIGPNLAGEFVNSVPVCGKDYYFVLRAVDASDNASGTIGDSFTTTSSTTTTGTTGSTGGTGAIALSGTKAQIVDGTMNTDGSKDASISGSADDTTVSPTPEILGSSTDQNKNYSRWYLIAAVILGYLVSRTLRAKKSK